MSSSSSSHLQRLSPHRRQRWVLRVDVYERVDQPHGGVGLVVHEALLPRHQLARRGLARARGTRQPEYPSLLLWLWSYVRTAGKDFGDILSCKYCAKDCVNQTILPPMLVSRNFSETLLQISAIKSW